MLVGSELHRTPHRAENMIIGIVYMAVILHFPSPLFI